MRHTDRHFSIFPHMYLDYHKITHFLMNIFAWLTIQLVTPTLMMVIT